MLGSYLHWTTVCTGWQHLEGIPANHLICFPFKSRDIQCPTLISIARGTLQIGYSCIIKFTNSQALHCSAGISSSWMQIFFTIEFLMFVHCLLRKGNRLITPLVIRLVWTPLDLLHHHTKQLYTKAVQRRL